VETKYISQKQLVKRTIITFTVFILSIASGIGGWFLLMKQPLDGGIRGGIQQPLRDVLNKNEKLFSGTFNSSQLVKEYPKQAAVKQARVNGDVGLDEEFFDAASWQLIVLRQNGDTLRISLDEIKQLPKVDVIHNFKCIEGWSEITHWSGVRMMDFIEHFHLEKEASLNYIGLSTPDEEYYVGIDMPAALHRQTILCYELNEKPLPMNQGYPLRLIIPVKYGIKSIKRIGTMYFSNEKPADYWAERGYDYYSGL
jgi:hypothetical protein